MEFGRGSHRSATSMTLRPEPSFQILCVRRSFGKLSLYATGNYTLDRLIAAPAPGITSKSGKPLSRSLYHRMLQNPLYCGIIRNRGEYFEGKHEPIISKTIFDSMPGSDRREANRSHRDSSRISIAEYSVATSAAALSRPKPTTTTTTSVAPSGGPCSQPYLREEEIGKQIAKIIRSIVIPSGVHRLVTRGVSAGPGTRGRLMGNRTCATPRRH